MSKPNTIPRNYQLQLLEYAKNQNIVTVLNTGSGKTLIAVLLLKYIHSIDSRVSVFLVPAVPLVSQQSKYIQSHTTLNVQEAYGSMGVDTWDSEKWQAVTHLNNILVMTPQVLLNSIHSNFLNLNDISCLVFDEAHHCRGSHPYNQLMEVYRHHKGTRPKIFGMTASPSCSGSDCLESLKYYRLI